MVADLITGLMLIFASLFTYFLVKRWIPVAKKFEFVGKDLNKYKKPLVAEGGGIAVLFSLTISLFLYLFLKTVFFSPDHITEIYALISTFLLAGLIGFIDDILGWKKGIPQRYKVLLTTVLALPLMTITFLYPQYNYFSSWGISPIVYSLIIVPIGIIGSSNAINMLGGYNGLESGVSLIILSTLGLRALMLNEEWIAVLSFIGVASLLGFLVLNWYPAKVFPGDTLTYAIGAYIGSIVILGKMIFFGLALFSILFLEAILYFRARVIDKAGKVLAQGIPREDGTIDLIYKHIYDSCHLAIMLQKKIRGYATERGVVITIYLIQVGIATATFIIAYLLR